LELEPYRSRGPALGARGDARRRAEQVLDVMPVLVGDDVRLRERAAAGTEPLLELVVEAEVDVHLRVDGAVEGPDRRGRLAATGRDPPVEEHGRRGLVAVELAAPELLHGVHDGHDATVPA